MELTEQERLMLVGKKDEIRKLTEKILELAPNPEQNKLELNKMVTGILSLLSTIASYSKCKNDDLQRITYIANVLTQWGQLDMDFLHEYFCNEVNSIRFDFTGKDLKIIIPKIDISLYRAK